MPTSDPETLAVWFSHIVAAPKHWKTIVCKFNQRYVYTTPAQQSTNQDDGIVHECTYDGCSRSFPNYVTLCTHQVHVHKMYNPIRLRHTGTKCTVCGRDFHTLSRAFRHIAYRSPSCKEYHSILDPVVTVEQLEQTLLEEQRVTKSRGIKFIN